MWLQTSGHSDFRDPGTITIIPPNLSDFPGQAKVLTTVYSKNNPTYVISYDYTRHRHGHDGLQQYYQRSIFFFFFLFLFLFLLPYSFFFLFLLSLLFFILHSTSFYAVRCWITLFASWPGYLHPAPLSSFLFSLSSILMPR